MLLAGKPEQASRHFRPVRLTQEAKQDVDALRRAHRTLKDAAQSGQWAFVYYHLIARLEGMQRQTALFLDPPKLGPDHLDCLIWDDRWLALEAQDTTESGNPFQGGDASCLKIALHKEVGGEQRNRTLGRARNQEW